jgi:hypothetical protein
MGVGIDRNGDKADCDRSEWGQIEMGINGHGDKSECG